MDLRLIESTDDYTYLALSGRMDIAGVGAIETKFTAFTASRQKPALVDISEVNFISSLGIRLFLSVAKSLHANGSKLILISPQSNIRETLQLSDISQFIPIAADTDEALNSLKVRC